MPRPYTPRPTTPAVLLALTWPELMRSVKLHAPRSPGRAVLETEAARRERRARPAPDRAAVVRIPSKLNPKLSP